MFVCGNRKLLNYENIASDFTREETKLGRIPKYMGDNGIHIIHAVHCKNCFLINILDPSCEQVTLPHHGIDMIKTQLIAGEYFRMTLWNKMVGSCEAFSCKLEVLCNVDIRVID